MGPCRGCHASNDFVHFLAVASSPTSRRAGAPHCARYSASLRSETAFSSEGSHPGDRHLGSCAPIAALALLSF
jgi:hypothetical protein